MSKRLLILQCGSVMAEVASLHGEFGAWFSRALAGEGLDIHVAEVTTAPPPVPDGFDGILITGSLASAHASDPWILRLSQWIRRHAFEGRPMLGVCFGHQLLCHALGGRARRHPHGMEAGTRKVLLTEEGARDWLFDGCPGEFSCQQTHNDEVELLPPGAIPLAGNTHSIHQAFALGEGIRGVQFHPEIDVGLMQTIVECGIREGWAAEGSVGTIRATPFASRVLRIWAKRVKLIADSKPLSGA
jgi:GMP synthase (glutamine-hydrolysing)